MFTHRAKGFLHQSPQEMLLSGDHLWFSPQQFGAQVPAAAPLQQQRGAKTVTKADKKAAQKASGAVHEGSLGSKLNQLIKVQYGILTFMALAV